jgi:hypothetical protein
MADFGVPHAARRRVTLFAFRELHLQVLEPVYRALAAMPGIEVGFTAPPFLAGAPGRPEEGLRPSTITDLRARGFAYWGENPTNERFDAVVLADVCYDRVEAWGPVVCVGHGTISKNIFFIDNVVCRRESWADVLCVPGPWYVGSFGDQVRTRIEPTGFPKMDDYARDYSAEKASLFARIGFSPQRRTLLFAPTYNPEFSGLQILADHWERLDPRRYQVLVKLHGATSEPERAQYRALCARLPHLHYVDDPNLVPYMKMADVVISDVSSAFVEAFVLDVPVVVVNNPRMYGFAMYNPKAVEFAVRDGAYGITEGHQLGPLLEQLATQDPLRERRRHYALALFPAVDGRNAQRAAEVCWKLAMGHGRRVPRVVPDILVIPDHRFPYWADNVAWNLQQRRWPEGSVLLRTPAELQALRAALERRGASAQLQCVPQAVPAGRAYLCMTGEHFLPREWDFVLDLFFAYHRSDRVVGPLLGGATRSEPQHVAHYTRQPLPDAPDVVQHFFKYTRFHAGLDVPTLRVDGMYLPAALPEPFVSGIRDHYHRPELRDAFFECVVRMGFHPAVVVGCYGVAGLAPVCIA